MVGNNILGMVLIIPVQANKGEIGHDIGEETIIFVYKLEYNTNFLSIFIKYFVKYKDIYIWILI